MDPLLVCAAVLGAAIVINVLLRFHERLTNPRRTPKDYEQWIEEIRSVLFQMVEADIDRHNLEMRFSALLGRQPPEYDGLAREAFARTLLLHPALAAKAEQCGLFPEGTFARVGVPRYLTFNPVESARIAGAELPAAEPPAAEPPSDFVGTVKVARERGNGAAMH
jgi:hypothetical protein